MNIYPNQKSDNSEQLIQEFLDVEKQDIIELVRLHQFRHLFTEKIDGLTTNQISTFEEFVNCKASWSEQNKVGCGHFLCPRCKNIRWWDSLHENGILQENEMMHQQIYIELHLNMYPSEYAIVKNAEIPFFSRISKLVKEFNFYVFPYFEDVSLKRKKTQLKILIVFDKHKGWKPKIAQYKNVLMDLMCEYSLSEKLKIENRTRELKRNVETDSIPLMLNKDLWLTLRTRKSTRRLFDYLLQLDNRQKYLSEVNSSFEEW